MQAGLKPRHEPLLWVNPVGAWEHLQPAQLTRSSSKHRTAAALESGSTSRFSLRSSCDGSFTWSVASGTGCLIWQAAGMKAPDQDALKLPPAEKQT